MLDRLTLVVLLALSAVLSIAGCKAAREDTPKQAAVRFYQAMTDRSRAAIAECTEGTDEEIAAACAMADMWGEMKSLENAVTARFGEKALQTGLFPLATAMAPSIDEMKKSALASKVIIDGDTATLIRKGEGSSPLVLKRRDGRWRMTVATQDEQFGPAERIAAMTRMTRAFMKARAELQRPDSTLNSVQKILAEMMMPMLMGGGR